MNQSHPQQQKSEISVVQLAEALVQGDVLIALQECGEPAPAWGYLNLLAHSDRSSLRRVRDFNQSRRPLSGWGTVVFDLIVDILSSAPTDEELVVLQRKALVPLELRIWDGQELLSSPQDLDILVRSALYRYMGQI
ncbi:MAG TPA: hypothetical protein VK425_04070 [Acidimicrobiales bacterium]|nr:hypothetical protein [Acidimicrobiales bacterium]